MVSTVILCWNHPIRQLLKSVPIQVVSKTSLNLGVHFFLDLGFLKFSILSFLNAVKYSKINRNLNSSDTATNVFFMHDVDCWELPFPIWTFTTVIKTANDPLVDCCINIYCKFSGIAFHCILKWDVSWFDVSFIFIALSIWMGVCFH